VESGDQEPIVLAGPTGDVLSLVGLTDAALTAAERERADALRRPGARDDFVAAHLLVRHCAARILGVAPAAVTIVQRCQRCGGPHGQPTVVGAPQVGVSLSHTRGHVAAAAAVGPVGVDVEPVVTDRVLETIARRVLAAGEQAALTGLAAPAAATALTRQWVRKEALIKIGALTLDGLARLDLSGLPDGSAPGRVHHARVPGAAASHLVDWVDPDLDLLGAAVAPHPPAVARATPYGWQRLPD
jgi:4'-phosphopantetheinyl transferase